MLQKSLGLNVTFLVRPSLSIQFTNANSSFLLSPYLHPLPYFSVTPYQMILIYFTYLKKSILSLFLLHLQLRLTAPSALSPLLELSLSLDSCNHLLLFPLQA